MELEEAVLRLRQNMTELRGIGVRSLAVFGSVARGEADATSDVDVLVEFVRPVSHFEFFDVRKRLEEILGRRVDLVVRDALHPALRDRILEEAVDAG